MPNTLLRVAEKWLHHSLRDVEARQSGDRLTLGNRRLRRVWELGPHGPAALSLKNRDSGFCWEIPGRTRGIPVFDLPGFDFARADRVLSATSEKGADGKPELHLHIDYTGPAQQVRFVFTLRPDSPILSTRVWVKGQGIQSEAGNVEVRERFEVIESLSDSKTGQDSLPASQSIDCIPHDRRHLIARVFRFYDATDHHDPVRIDQTVPLYDFRRQQHRGNVFVLEDTPSGEGLLLVKESPSPEAQLKDPGHDLITDGRAHYAALTGSGLDLEKLDPGAWQAAYGSAVGVGPADQLARAYKQHYRAGCQAHALDALCIQSNTWGDRNRDKAVGSDFIQEEITAAAAIGQTCVGIDDGWQTGVTINSARPGGERLWEGYHNGRVPFWEVDAVRFPEGLHPILRQAHEVGRLDVLLWFSPDSHDDFTAAEKDLRALLDLFHRYGVHNFKLDGIKIRNKLGETRLRWLLDELSRRTGGAVIPVMDCTAEVRFGYFYERQHGLIFLENRYTDWGNYFPHRTLRNLWLLAEWLPTRRFQIEVLNPLRNGDQYGDDPYAPARYGLDYLYAIALVAQPLLWMEVSSLTAEQRHILRGMTDFHREIDPALRRAEVQPIGELPGGRSITGFQVDDPEGGTHLLVFREPGAPAEAELPLRAPAAAHPGSTIRVLRHSEGTHPPNAAITAPNRLRIHFPDTASFAWLDVSA